MTRSIGNPIFERAIKRVSRPGNRQIPLLPGSACNIFVRFAKSSSPARNPSVNAAEKKSFA
jgi:hypothetical protein